MNLESIYPKLSEYILALRQGLDVTNQSELRPLITARLAAAAQLFALLESSQELKLILPLIESESRAHGCSFIPGQYGEEIAQSWLAFKGAVEL